MFKEQRIPVNFILAWTAKEFNLAWAAQKGLCSICKRTLSKQGRSINSVCADHCHKTKKILGLLCIKCNLLIGAAYDDVDILKGAIKYLRKHS